MHAVRKLHKIFQDALPSVHKIRLNGLMQAVETLLLQGAAGQPASLVQEAQASVAMTGRSIVLYEEVHPKKLENNHKVHKNFLKTLQSILPPGTMPIIVTDAGFRAPWFRAVLALGWHFVGRLRSRNSVQMLGSNRWQLSSSFYVKASDTPIDIGEGILTPKSKVFCQFIIYKEPKKNREKLNKNKNKSKSRESIKYAKGNAEPWLIVTSIEQSKERAFKAINIYKKRMQIEENIRDTKSQYGFRLNESLTRTPERMGILLLIAAVASLICWLAGILAKKWQLGPKFQAASSKFTSKLSMVFLGKEVLKTKIKMTKKDLLLALQILRAIALQMPHKVF